jgi:hypothetical protein
MANVITNVVLSVTVVIPIVTVVILSVAKDLISL